MGLESPEDATVDTKQGKAAVLASAGLDAVALDVLVAAAVRLPLDELDAVALAEKVTLAELEEEEDEVARAEGVGDREGHGSVILRML